MDRARLRDGSEAFLLIAQGPPSPAARSRHSEEADADEESHIPLRGRTF